MIVMFRPKIRYRSVDYGSTFTNIESQLDASDPDPLLWPIFYISPSNKNKVRPPIAMIDQFD